MYGGWLGVVKCIEQRGRATMVVQRRPELLQNVRSDLSRYAVVLTGLPHHYSHCVYPSRYDRLRGSTFRLSCSWFFTART